MKKFMILILLIFILPLSGCFNYRDMNRLLFATTTLIDIDNKGNVVIYAEAFKAFRGEAQEAGTEKRVLMRGTGKTIFDAFIKMSLAADYEIDYSQNKALIFTKRAAEYGLDNFVDDIARNQKTTLRQYILVYTGNDPEGLIKTQMTDEPFLGLFIQNLMASQERLGKIYSVRINEFYNNRETGSTVNVVPIITKSKEQMTDRIEINGGAVLEHDKMVDILSPDEIFSYNFATRRGRNGILLADSPNYKGKYISLKILSSKPKISVSYDGSSIQLDKNIKIKAAIVEAQKSLFPMNDAERRKIEQSAEERIKRGCTDLFEEYKEKNIDIYNVTRLFEIKYPNIKLENILAKTESKSIVVSVHIEGSNNTTDFK